MVTVAFDDVLRLQVGEFGRCQRFLVVLLGTHGVLAVLLCLDTAFTAARVDSRCRAPSQPPGSALTPDGWLNVTIPWQQYRGRWRRDPCSVNVRNYSAAAAVAGVGGAGDGRGGELNVTSIRLPAAARGRRPDAPRNASLAAENSPGAVVSRCRRYVYDNSTFHSTIVTEWDLVCVDEYLVPVTKAVVVAGVIAGTAFGGFSADRFGRKILAIMTIPLVVVAKIVIIFSPNLIVYNIFNFLAVAGGAINYLVTFTLSVELVGPNWTAVAGCFLCEFYAVGFLLLALLGYLLPVWRLLTVANTVLIVPIMTAIFIIPESPRWLLARGDLVEARKVLHRIARLNGRSLREGVLSGTNTSPSKSPERVWHLWSSRDLLLQGGCIFFAWFTAGMTYYGMVVSMASWTGKVHLDLAVSGCIELLAYLLVQGLLSSCLGRRVTTCGAYLLTGTALLFSIAVPLDTPRAVTALTVLGRMCVCGAYAGLYVWTAELLPTGLRTTGISVYSCLGKLGAIPALFTENLASIHPIIPFVMMGTSSLVAGSLLLLLPETRSRHLPQTMSSVPTRNGSPDDIPNLVPGIQEHFRNVFGVTVHLISMEQRSNSIIGDNKLLRGINTATANTSLWKPQVKALRCPKKDKLIAFQGRPNFAI